MKILTFFVILISALSLYIYITSQKDYTLTLSKSFFDQAIQTSGWTDTKWLYISSISKDWFQITFEMFFQQDVYFATCVYALSWQSEAFCAFSKLFAFNSIMNDVGAVSIATICNPTSLNTVIQKVCDKVLSGMMCGLRTFSSREWTSR